MKKSKYHNIKTEVDGILFDSKKEANRYAELKLLKMAGEITNLKLQPKFPISVKGIPVCTYKADFCYYDRKTNQRIVEDVKSAMTAKLPVYRLKKKLVKAEYGIEIQEV